MDDKEEMRLADVCFENETNQTSTTVVTVATVSTSVENSFLIFLLPGVQIVSSFAHVLPSIFQI